ncbi:hypothetical protein ElyMa_004237100 [Elysia marginata]|uniref:Uncharacterized protein n=1 Tax=Elysia marginata TaxID=1093978 RepID=A0AAV4GTQ4_9GAST|nr:hypothetical protein ElyMa_004237100 [Elysia marginata]
MNKIPFVISAGLLSHRVAVSEYGTNNLQRLKIKSRSNDCNTVLDPQHGFRSTSVFYKHLKPYFPAVTFAAGFQDGRTYERQLSVPVTDNRSGNDCHIVRILCKRLQQN